MSGKDKTMFVVTGYGLNFSVICDTREQANKVVAFWEDGDKQGGCFEPNEYYIFVQSTDLAPGCAYTYSQYTSYFQEYNWK